MGFAGVVQIHSLHNSKTVRYRLLLSVAAFYVAHGSYRAGQKLRGSEGAACVPVSALQFVVANGARSRRKKAKKDVCFRWC